MGISASSPRRAPRARSASSNDGFVSAGKALVVLGLGIAAVGVLVLLAGRIPWLGRLPGDIHIERGSWSFYFPLATSILVSVVISLVLYLIGRR